MGYFCVTHYNAVTDSLTEFVGSTDDATAATLDFMASNFPRERDSVTIETLANGQSAATFHAENGSTLRIVPVQVN